MATPAAAVRSRGEWRVRRAALDVVCCVNLTDNWRRTSRAASRNCRRCADRWINDEAAPRLAQSQSQTDTRDRSRMRPASYGLPVTGGQSSRSVDERQAGWSVGQRIIDKQTDIEIVRTNRKLWFLSRDRRPINCTAYFERKQTTPAWRRRDADRRINSAATCLINYYRRCNSWTETTPIPFLLESSRRVSFFEHRVSFILASPFAFILRLDTLIVLCLTGIKTS